MYIGIFSRNATLGVFISFSLHDFYVIQAISLCSLKRQIKTQLTNKKNNPFYIINGGLFMPRKQPNQEI